MIHGGFQNSKYNRSLEDNVANDLVDYGIIVCNFDYRSIDNQGGYSNTFYDVSNGNDLLIDIDQQQGFNTNRIIVVGHSAAGFITGRFR